MRCHTSLVPHEQPIVRPKVSDTLDYEAEMVVVIGKQARHLTMDNAYSCIAGYSCFNEGSVREFQRKTTQWDMGKNFDKHRRLRPLDDHRRRSAGRRQGPEDPDQAQRQGHAVRQHRQHDVPGRRDAGLHHPGHHARAGRHHHHRHAVRRRLRAQAAGLHEAAATPARSTSKASACWSIRSWTRSSDCICRRHAPGTVPGAQSRARWRISCLRDHDRDATGRARA